MIDGLNDFLYNNRLLLIFGEVYILIIMWSYMLNKTKNNWEETYLPMLGECIVISISLIIWSKIFSINNHYISELGNVGYGLKAISNVMDILFNKYLSVLTLAIFGFSICEILFLRHDLSVFKEVAIKYIDIMIYGVYVIIVISCNYDLKYIIVSFISQICLVTSKCILLNIDTCTKEVSSQQLLYKSRQVQLNSLYRLISKPEKEVLSIAINGEWGSGKTFFIKKLLDKIKDEHYSIYISPLLINDTSKLLSKFESELISIFKANRIYTGRRSAVEMYFKQIFQLIKVSDCISISQLIKEDKRKVEYEKNKKMLQQQIDILLKNNEKNLIIIIDDFDRASSEQRKNILSFMNQVLDFKGCVVIFGLDFNNISNNGTINKEYMEKFIDTTFMLHKPSSEEIIDCYKDKIAADIKQEPIEKIRNSILKKISLIEENLEKYLLQIIENKEKNIEEIKSKQNGNISKEEEIKAQEEKYMNEAKYFNEQLCIIKSRLTNSRKIIHFIEDINNRLIQLNELYCRQDENGKNVIKQVVENTPIEDIIIFISYIAIFNKASFYELIELGGMEEYIANAPDEYDDKSFIRGVYNTWICPTDITNLFSEKSQIRQKNSYLIIKGLYINEKYLLDEIDIRTNEQKILDEIKLLNEYNVITTPLDQVYSVLSYKDNKEDISICKKLNKYVFERLYCQDKIGNQEIIDYLHILSKHHTAILTSEYISEWLSVLNKHNIKVDIQLHERVKSGLELEMTNIVMRYGKYFIKLLSYLNTVRKRTKECTMKNIESVEQLIRVMSECRIIKYNEDDSLLQKLEGIRKKLNNLKEIGKSEQLCLSIRGIQKEIDLCLGTLINIVKIINKLESEEALCESEIAYGYGKYIDSESSANRAIDYLKSLDSIQGEKIVIVYRILYYIYHRNKDMISRFDEIIGLYRKITLSNQEEKDILDQEVYIELTTLLNKIKAENGKNS